MVDDFLYPKEHYAGEDIPGCVGTGPGRSCKAGAPHHHIRTIHFSRAGECSLVCEEDDSDFFGPTRLVLRWWRSHQDEVAARPQTRLWVTPSTSHNSSAGWEDRGLK